MPKALSFFFFFFCLRGHVVSLNFIAFILSIETKVSLLALVKSIYYTKDSTTPSPLRIIFAVIGSIQLMDWFFLSIFFIYLVFRLE